ncbi:hypothetical protein K432DRAFT_445805 [Lepidopterella palustris CBS 459.81]|uniref:ATPase AAA-type core domain-containing protein n=1 Tax=Lepidopterella palustris CBS 459.81 TaxID=1314670 RepID=A0A8E2E3S9_9PEZI|nr:hypothetical protein K432DRAFT_445805 [Lepidopterella palustris CBS 459.81]
MKFAYYSDNELLRNLIRLIRKKWSRRSMIEAGVDGPYSRILINYNCELQGKEPIQVSLNLVFLGPPGTGKRTVVKLYGQVLAETGLLSSGEVMVKNPTDFIGRWIGWSEDATRKILSAVMSKVVIIDEAYMLYSGSRSDSCFRTAAVDNNRLGS